MVERAARKLARQQEQPLSESARLEPPKKPPSETARIDPPPPPEVDERPAAPTPIEKSRAVTPVNHVELNFSRLSRAGIYSPELKPNRTTEEFRLIKHAALARIQQAIKSGLGNSNVIMVTSAREGEGKTFVSANLAMSIATERDRSVILVDADPSRSAVARNFSIDAARGLLDALEDESVKPSDVVLQTNVHGLSLIPAGPKRPLSAELYASGRMVGFLDQLVAQFPKSVVVFDAPPVLATGEPSALAQHVGQIIFVVEAEKTGRAAIREALNLINICPNIGFVLNKAQFRFGSVRFGNYYDYYYSR
jgi:receptor protein-tyrosine kinase